MEEVKARVIKSPKDARQLLKWGHTIIDIKEKRQNPGETVFIFKCTDEFLEDFKKLEKKDK